MSLKKALIPRRIDLRSDTLTLPSLRMRQAMSEALMGDDVYGEDSTCAELEAKGAQLIGKEACVFVSSGTMGNLAALMAHCNLRGSEYIVGDRQHTYNHEQGGTSVLAGIHPRVVVNEDDGTLPIDRVLAAIQSENVHNARTQVVSIENTHNMCGGKVLALSYIEKLKASLQGTGVKLHMDGARAGNAAVALKVPLSRVCQHVDSVSLCLSKGLGAPVGSLVAGSASFVYRVRRARKVLGGGWRQAGGLAAAGLIALEEMEETLDRDHHLAKELAVRLLALNASLSMPQTNLVFFHLPNNAPVDTVVELCKERGLFMGSGYGENQNQIRAVIHKDISSEDVEEAAVILSEVLTAIAK